MLTKEYCQVPIVVYGVSMNDIESLTMEEDVVVVARWFVVALCLVGWMSSFEESQVTK
jgi:hypothetical protein